MTTIQLAGNYYQFYLSRIPAQQQLSLVLMPVHQENADEMEWPKRLYELHEFLDGHFYPIEKAILFRPIFPGSAELLEMKVGFGALPLEQVSELLLQELMQFK